VKDESDVEMAWHELKECLLEVAGDVCGTTKGKQRNNETWWWNAEVPELVKNNRRLFKINNKSKRGTDRRIEEDKRKYVVAKHATKKEYRRHKQSSRESLAKNWMRRMGREWYLEWLSRVRGKTEMLLVEAA